MRRRAAGARRSPGGRARRARRAASPASPLRLAQRSLTQFSLRYNLASRRRGPASAWLDRLLSMSFALAARGGTAVNPHPARRALAEFLGTGLLVALVVGSGIMAQRLSPTEVGLQLLENSTATALGLMALILIFAPLSGAHFNPVV